MKKKFLFTCLIISLLVLAFAICASAATTNEFGEIETIEGIDLSSMNTDTTARVVIVDANGIFHTYPAQYIVSNNTKFYYNFTPINTALKTSYNKNSVVRIEVPNNITIATNCGDLSSCTNLVEIKFFPDSQLHTLEYGCFYNNKKMEKLNIPKNVTTMGTLLINNSTLKELVFDDGFSAIPPSDSFKGASGVEKVVFSNQMTEVADRAFDSTLGESLKEFYFGANLKNLGTNNMAWVKQSVKFYIQGDFLAEADSITMETFSWWSSTACLPTGVIFFTGSIDKVNALIQKSSYDRLFCTSASLVKWDSAKSDDSYVPKSGWTIVYDYNTCNAFYGSQHLEDTNPCLIECARCNMQLQDPNASHVFTELYAYANGFASAGTVTKTCQTENCICNITPLINELNPIYSCLGFSVNELGTSMTLGYTFDKDAYDAYIKNTGGSISFGFVAYATYNDEFCSPVNANENVIAPNDPSSTIFASMSTSYNAFDFVIRGFDETTQDFAIAMCAFTYDGESVKYLCTDKNGVFGSYDVAYATTISKEK